MSDITPDPQPLTPIPKRFGMPAKNCSWLLDGYNDETSTSAVITYARSPRGHMTKINGEWIGELECRINMKDGTTKTIRGVAMEGYPSSKVCGNQIWYKFRRSAMEQGFEFW